MQQTGKDCQMITEEMVTHWMRQRIAAGNYGTAASLAREFLDEHRICDVLDPDFDCVINAGFSLAPEIAQQKKGGSEEKFYYEYS
jgi:hypothetical protein